jgi:hypothetical protein
MEDGSERGKGVSAKAKAGGFLQSRRHCQIFSSSR